MDARLLEKFYRGECSPQEVKEILLWFKSQGPGVRQHLDMQAIWDETQKQHTDHSYTHNADATWKNILNTVTPEPKTSAEPVAEGARIYPIKNWLGVDHVKVAAAIMLPLCCLAFMLYLLTGNNSIQAAPLVTIEALPGVKKTVTLADGSVVTLNSGSQISYPADFAPNKREIVLKGEAFFEVAKDSSRPFLVKACNISTEALGTSFNIRCQPKDSTITVALVTGLVEIEHEAQQQHSQLARLEPGQQLVYNKTKKQHRLETFDTHEVITWKEGTLVFRKANLAQVVKKLENWYGVTIEIAGKAPQDQQEWHYTGEYSQEDIETVLDGISFVKHFSYKRKNKSTIILTFNNQSL